MAQEIIEAVRDRFSLKDKNKYFIQGTLPHECETEVYLDQKRIDTFAIQRTSEFSSIEI